jgi:hypothetical protein
MIIAIVLILVFVGAVFVLKSGGIKATKDKIQSLAYPKTGETSSAPSTEAPKKTSSSRVLTKEEALQRVKEKAEAFKKKTPQ